MALSDIPGMPTWTEMATKIAQDYIDCLWRADEAEAAGDISEAKGFRKLAADFKRLMDKYQITIRTKSSV